MLFCMGAWVKAVDEIVNNNIPFPHLIMTTSDYFAYMDLYRRLLYNYYTCPYKLTSTWVARVMDCDLLPSCLSSCFFSLICCNPLTTCTTSAQSRQPQRHKIHYKNGLELMYIIHASGFIHHAKEREVCLILVQSTASLFVSLLENTSKFHPKSTGMKMN